jgi:hypothetical protein
MTRVVKYSRQWSVISCQLVHAEIGVSRQRGELVR